MTCNQAQKVVLHRTLFVAGLLASASAAALDLAQKPLFLAQGVRPNLVFIMDDSGSMTRNYMPVDIEDYDYQAKRSSSANRIYYDPDINYKAWIRADGTRWVAPTPSEADPDPTDDSAPGDSGFRGTDLTLHGCIEREGFICQERGPVYAYYYRYDGGPESDASSYTRVNITEENAPFDRSSEGAARDDCNNPAACSYQEEIQNFANWYTYYRKRTFTARAGVAEAFQKQGDNLRVGYDAINEIVDDGDSNGDDGVNVALEPDRFDADQKEEFFRRLYDHSADGDSTPLRNALKSVGRYYENHDSPWETVDGGETTLPDCRGAYTVLMSDGYWNQGSPSVGNVDARDGTRITNHNGESEFKYGGDGAGETRRPFEDGYSDTLADVAMHYWKRDIRPDLDNRLSPSSRDPAYWQHMVTYGVGLGVEGSIDSADAFTKARQGEEIEWGDPSGQEDEDKIDDLLHAAVNSRGGFFSASKPEVFASKISSLIEDIANRAAGSGASVSASSTRLNADSTIFQGRFDSQDWTGDLVAVPVTGEGELDLDAKSWRAASMLDDRDLASNPRTILTTDDLNSTTAGADFAWQGLSTEQQQALDGDDGLGKERLAYLRGDHDKEARNGGNFRDRNSRLGDIINSSPAYTHDENFGYATFGPTDTSGGSYRKFLTGTLESNPPMVYVGGNDGMLHGFNANTGVEAFAYVPHGVYERLANLTDQDYTHKYFVDGSVKVGDVYDYAASQWRRILVGTLGAGGETVFALDVSDPADMSADDVLWEYSHDELGEGVSDPSLVRVEDQQAKGNRPVYQWHIVFANGYNSDSGKSQLFVVDAITGEAARNAPFELGSGSGAETNGLAAPFVVDEDQDHNADFIYAGDLMGNVWKLINNDRGQWEKSPMDGFHNGDESGPGNDGSSDVDGLLFTARDGDGDRQPVTSKVNVGLNGRGEKTVVFGTGKYLEPTDTGDTQGPRDLYGVVDRDTRVEPDDLLKQELEEQTTENGRDYRIVSSNEYESNEYSGWRISLEPGDNTAAEEGERSVVQPLVRGSVVTFVTIVPSDQSCSGGGGHSWITAVDISSGARLGGSFFDVDDDGDIDAADRVNHNDGEVAPTSLKSRAGIIDTPSVLVGDGFNVLIESGSGGEGATNVRPDTHTGPQSWREVR